MRILVTGKNGQLGRSIQKLVNPISSQQFPSPTKRPRNTLMNKDKIVRVFNIKISYLKSSLNNCMTILKNQQ